MVRGLGAVRGTTSELADAVRPGLHRTHIALLAQSRSADVREAVARRDDVPFGVQAALAHDDLQEVRGAMAANPRAAVAVMQILADDSHHAVQFAVAGNPSCPRHVAEILAGRRRADVRNAAIRRLEVHDPVVAAAPPDPFARCPELRDRVSEAAHFVELRDRVSAPSLSVELRDLVGEPALSVAEPAEEPSREGSFLPLEDSLSHLAQRLGASQWQTNPYFRTVPATAFRA